jgi:tetratricopeptide (TPR) repeat protein
MNTENQQKDTNSTDRSIARYSSPVFNRGLELAKKVSTATLNNQDEQLLSGESTQDAEYFFKLAVQQISRSEYQHALINFQKALDLNPDYYEVYTIRYSLIYMPLGCYQEVINDCIEALRLQPDNAGVMAIRGWVYAQLGHHLEALRDYDLALIIRPDLEAVYMNRGVTRSVLGDHQGALSDCTKVIGFSTDNSLAYIVRSKVYYDLGYTLQATNDFIKGYMLSGNQLLDSGDYVKAIESYTNVLKVDPNNSEAYNRRSTARSAIGDYQGAREDLQQVRMI